MKFHFCRQLDGMDCGPACLCMIAKHYGANYSIQELRDIACITRVGVSLLGISEASEKIGLRATAVQVSLEYFVNNAKTPCIVHWNQQHFVVVYKIKKSFSAKTHIFYIADPAYGLIKYEEEKFIRCWCGTKHNGKSVGIAMYFTPTPDFYQKGHCKKRQIKLKSCIEYLKPYKALFSHIILGLLVGSVIQLSFPLLTQSIVDYGIEENNLNFIHLILIAQLFLVLSYSIIDIIRRWTLLHISTRINVSLMSDFLMEIMKLPMIFFDSKLMGDLIQRIDDHKRIEDFLTTTILNSIFSTFTIIIFGIILIIYNIRMFFILLIGSSLYLFWVSLFMKKRSDLDHKNFATMAVYQSDIIELIEGMQEIKLTGSEQQKRWRWGNLQASIFQIKLQSLSLGQWQQVGGVLINEITSIFITIMSATAVLKGELTLGGMLSVQYIIGQLQSPIHQFVSIAQQIQDAKISLYRLNEIHNKDDEEDADVKRKIVVTGKDSIVFDNVSFSYGGSRSKYVLSDLSLTIPHGKTTAIVGLSGSGKTTMIKLMLGFYTTSKGTIRIGNDAIEKYSYKELRKHCGVVMQDGFIFSDTIANNIAAGATKIDKRLLKQAAQMANIENFIMSLPLRYNTIIGNSGIGLSQGQKQRVLIARAIYRNPDYVFLDEATNALDTMNERCIISNLNQVFRGKTIVIVAHRLSTVKNADNIVVLEEGRIVEQGNHEFLIRKKGRYFDLIKEQLEIANT